jgi:hypothetical protein
LEVEEAEKAELVNGPYISRDLNDQPIVGYFPQALHPYIVEETHGALGIYLDACPFRIKPDANGASNTNDFENANDS